MTGQRAGWAMLLERVLEASGAPGPDHQPVAPPPLGRVKVLPPPVQVWPLGVAGGEGEA